MQWLPRTCGRVHGRPGRPCVPSCSLLAFSALACTVSEAPERGTPTALPWQPRRASHPLTMFLGNASHPLIVFLGNAPRPPDRVTTATTPCPIATPPIPLIVFAVATSTRADGYECTADTTVLGVADVPLASGKSEDTGFTRPACEKECSAKPTCHSLVYADSNGYCELWSFSLSLSPQNTTTHCRKTHGEVS